MCVFTYTQTHALNHSHYHYCDSQGDTKALKVNAFSKCFILPLHHNSSAPGFLITIKGRRKKEAVVLPDSYFTKQYIYSHYFLKIIWWHMVDKAKPEDQWRRSAWSHFVAPLGGGAHSLTHTNLCEPDYITNENCAPHLKSKFGILKKEHTHIFLFTYILSL